MKKVYIVGHDISVEKMFLKEGFFLVYDLNHADIVCFTGGEDVHPSIYGQTMMGARGCNLARDSQECGIYEIASQNDIPMVGICRGGQFLNVLQGGKMIQHLGKTISGLVKAEGEKVYIVDVDHHQGIIPREDASVLLSKWHRMPDGETVELGYSVVYRHEKILCFQPHPEWGHEETKKIFFSHLQEVLE